MRKKVILFYNPRSGSGIFNANLDAIVERYQAAGYLIVPLRASDGLSLEEFLGSLDKDTYQDEYYQIIAAGGDGSINICVNAMIKAGIDLPLALFPAGTANDFAYYFDINKDIDLMMDVALGGRVMHADVGTINDKYFVNVAALGPAAELSQNTDPELKHKIGMLAYYMQTLKVLPKLKPITVKLETKDATYEEEMYFMVVINGKSAGTMRNLGSASEINDGLLDVYLFRNMNIVQLLPLFIKILKGEHDEDSKVLHFKTDNLRLTSNHHVSTDIDGEHGPTMPLTFGVMPKRLRIFSPLGEAVPIDECPSFVENTQCDKEVQ